MVKGSCECRAVTFEVTGALRQVTVCHCSQCRKSSGHIWAATRAEMADVKIVHSNSLKWYRSSQNAQRGFCSECGSSLFWKVDGTSTISIGAGTLDGDTGLFVAKEIYTEDKGDYYQIEGLSND